MSYSYFTSLKKMSGQNLQEEWTDEFYALLDDQFENAFDVYEIEEETFFDSKIYQDIRARINHVINTETGEKVGDDYKNILFREKNHSTYLGRFYKFDSNYWLAINVEKIKSLTTSTSVRRCNNVLRWLDSNGGYHEIPCVLDNKILENRNYSTAGSSLVLPSGVVECVTQLNNETNLIRPNQRFLFGNSGNWTAFKVQGGGINNYNNIETTNNSSGGLLKLTMSVDFVNEQTDNISLGIAEYYQYNFDVSILNGNISGTTSSSVQLLYQVLLNGQIVSNDVVWSVGNTAIATISSSGVLSFVSVGSTTVRCQLENNTSVYDEITVICVSTPVSELEIVLTPNINYIYLEESETFAVSLTENGITQADTFTFTLNPRTVTSDCYVFTSLTGNSFKVENLKAFLTDYISVTCSSNSRVFQKTFNFYLRGGW